MFKIIAAAAFVNDAGVSIHVGDETTISAELLAEHNRLCDEYGIPKHQVLEELEDKEPEGDEEKSKRGRKPKAEQNPEGGEGGEKTPEGGEKTPEGGEGGEKTPEGEL